MSQKIIICGCPLSGKSTVSNKISQKLNLSHIPTDGFVTAFEDTFPNLGIGHQNVVSVDTRKNVSERFYPFLKSFIKELDEESTYGGYIIEGFHIDIESVVRDFGNTHKILVFGYPDISEEEKLQIIRKYDINNWTNEVEDKELQKNIALFLELSKYYKSICKENSIEFIDTSFDRDNKIEKIISEII